MSISPLVIVEEIEWKGMVEDEDPELEVEDSLECVRLTSFVDELASPFTSKWSSRSFVLETSLFTLR